VIRRDLSALGRTATTALIAAIALAMAFLSWFGFRSVREWRRSSTLLELRRTEHAADRFVRALVRDMQGVESRVLRSVETKTLALALKGAEQRVVEAIRRNMSERMRTALEEEMSVLGKVRMSEVEEARAEIVRLIRALEQAGDIRVQRGDEDVYVS